MAPAEDFGVILLGEWGVAGGDFPIPPIKKEIDASICQSG